MGTVQAMVKSPQEECFSALTTMSASTARRITMMKSTATMAVIPATLPISSLAICPSDFPSRRMEAKRITKSCTAPATTTPAMSQSVPGR